MNKKAFIAAVFILISVTLRSQDNYVVDWDYTGRSFISFILETESRFPVRFFYEDEWVNELILGSYGEKLKLNEILDSLFSGKSIYYYPSGTGNIILTRFLAIKQLKENSTGSFNYIPGMDYMQDKSPGNISANLVINIGNPSDKNIRGNITLSGYISNHDTKEAVVGVTVFIPGLSAGTISNEFGHYNISIPRGSHSVRFTFIGMKEKIIDLNIFSPGELNVEMQNVLVPLKEAVITAEKDISLRRTETGVEKINIISFRLMPTTMGESDITKNILLIPGVLSVGEGSAGFNVRGGTADQNLILLYGAPVYNSSHLFGFFSAVNPDIIKDATLYKGGIPARYGGRLSSVLDIIPRDGNRRDFAGNAGLSPVTAHFTVEGPLRTDTVFYLLSGRTTYSDWILRLLDNPSLRNSRASFNDFNIRLTYDINRNNKIDFSAYYSFDSFRLNSDTIYKYRNNIISLRWRHHFSSRFFSLISVINSYYKYDISSLRVPLEAFDLTHRINNTCFKADLNWFTGRNELNFGTEMNYYDVIPGNYLPAHDSSIVIPRLIEKEKATEAALYLEDKYNITDRFSVNAGIRFSSFFVTGPRSVFLYSPDFTKSTSSITDTVVFGKFRNYKTYAGPELRISANYRLNDNSSFKLNYNHTRQYLHLLSNTVSISPSDIWKLSDYHLKPQSGDQFAAGYYRMLNKNKIEVSAEIYYRIIDNMIDFKGGTRINMNEHIERDLLNVQGKAYGFEVMFRKPEGRARWSISYTWSRMLTRSKGSFIEELINSGDWFPANHDRPHDLILTFNYIWSRRVSLSANYNFSSGRPVTYPVSSYMIDDIVITQYTDRNKYRIPYYSRMDFSVRISGNLKIKRLAHPHWIFSVYNLTGRDNVYSVFFRQENNRVKGYYLSVFGKPVPSLSFNFDF